jgi:drug/metabolite transporter (DMT)-like permease
MANAASANRGTGMVSAAVETAWPATRRHSGNHPRTLKSTHCRGWPKLKLPHHGFSPGGHLRHPGTQGIFEFMHEAAESNPCEPVIPLDGPVEVGPPLSVGKARLLALLAALMWSTSGFFAKSPYLSGWPGPALAFWRAVFASSILLPAVRRPRWTWRVVPMTLFFAAMNFTFLTAMEMGSAANAIWLQCTAPVWVLFVGVFVFGERAVARDWLMVAFAATGVAVIIYFESRGVALAAVAWGLASGLTYAGVVLSLRQLRGLDPVWLAALNHLVTAIVLVPFAFGANAPFPSGAQWLFLAGFGVLQMAVPYVLFAYSLQRIAGHEATGIGLIEPLLVPLWAYLAWGDRPAWWTLAGGAFILAGLVVRYFAPTHTRAAA